MRPRYSFEIMLEEGFFDPDRAFLVRRNKLPHWRQDGALYFVTFRLADSIPQEKLRVWSLDRDRWWRENPHPSACEVDAYQTTVRRRMERWLDRGLGSCVLDILPAKRIVDDALRYFDGERYELGEVAVAANHVHSLVRTANGIDLSQVLHSWKLKTARDILAVEDVKSIWSMPGRLWQHESFDHIVRNEAGLEKIRTYITNHKVGALS